MSNILLWSPLGPLAMPLYAVLHMYFKSPHCTRLWVLDSRRMSFHKGGDLADPPHNPLTNHPVAGSWRSRLPTDK